MIIDQLIAIPSPQSDDELPIERGQLTYKIKWSDLAGNDIGDLQSDMTTAQGDITALQSAMTDAQGDITDLQSDMTTAQSDIADLDATLDTVKSDIGIVEDTDMATHTISAGQYVIWKNALYTASQAIPVGTTLSSSNLTAVSGGVANDLKSNLSSIVTKGFAAYVIGSTTVKTSGNFAVNEAIKLAELSMHDLSTGLELSVGQTYNIGVSVDYKPVVESKFDVNRVDGGNAVGTIEFGTDGILRLKPLVTIPRGVSLRAHVTFFYQ